MLPIYLKILKRNLDNMANMIDEEVVKVNYEALIKLAEEHNNLKQSKNKQVNIKERVDIEDFGKEMIIVNRKEMDKQIKEFEDIFMEIS